MKKQCRICGFVATLGDGRLVRDADGRWVCPDDWACQSRRMERDRLRKIERTLQRIVENQS